MREEIRIGGKHSPYSKPRSLFIKNDTAIVSNQNSNKLIAVNLESYSVEEIEEFDDEITQYLEVGKYRFVLLKSGIYAV